MYLSIDIDVRSAPSAAPGTGTPEIGGLTSRELLQGAARTPGHLHLVGADVVEVAPAYDHAELTTVAAATVAYDLITLMAKEKREASQSGDATEATNAAQADPGHRQQAGRRQ